MKYLLLLLAAALAVVWFLRKSQRVRGGGAAAPREVERMVACGYCRVHLPLSEAVRTPRGYFCSPEHAAGQGAKSPDA